LAGKDSFSNFKHKNTQLSLRKLQRLSKRRAEAMNIKDMDDFYQIYAELIVEFEFNKKQKKIFNAGEAGLPMENNKR
jgi:hypothetical protein